ncbi:MAG: histidine phosphatase family protein [Pseudoflavonifractor sp.]|nr:histidine phosphatase family protein [Pseudoflavonifractor sp.]
MRLRIILLSLAATLSAITTLAADPTSTDYTISECQGSYMLYPTPSHPYDAPDSLTAVFINHVGRHGARFPSSAKNVLTMLDVLERADSLATITPRGRQLLAMTRRLARVAAGQWGALDSLGMAEQRGIASRMYMNFPHLFVDRRVDAMSSYSPRCVMSMYSFTHQLDRLNNKVELYTSAGRQNSPLLRFFDLDKEYLQFRADKTSKPTYDAYFDTTVPVTALHRILGDGYPYGSEADTRRLAYAEFRLVSGLNAAGIACDLGDFFTREEANRLWSVANLGHYLDRSSSTLSTIPADIASGLLTNLVRTLETAVNGESPATVMLRFGHAETLMPLLSLMRLRGCYYMTNYFDTVGQHWRDFYSVPMAANLQMILYRSDRGNYYLRVDLNEVPVPLMPNSDAIYTPWPAARDYMLRCIPLYYLD